MFRLFQRTKSEEEADSAEPTNNYAVQIHRAQAVVHRSKPSSKSASTSNSASKRRRSRKGSGAPSKETDAVITEDHGTSVVEKSYSERRKDTQTKSSDCMATQKSGSERRKNSRREQQDIPTHDKSASEKRKDLKREARDGSGPEKATSERAKDSRKEVRDKSAPEKASSKKQKDLKEGRDTLCTEKTEKTTDGSCRRLKTTEERDLEKSPVEKNAKVKEQKPSPTRRSSTERRRNIRLKYGLTEEQECVNTQCEDQEEFENVSAVVRPAATKMRKAKLRWKSPKLPEVDVEVSARGADRDEKLSSVMSDPFEENVETQDRDTVKEIKRRAGILTKNEVEKTQADASSGEVQMLIIRIQELELANNKAKLQMKRLRKQLREKEKKVEELKSLVAFLQKTANDEPDEKPTRGQEQVAMRGLEMMKRNQLLEQKVRNVERTMLCNFFEASEPKPNQIIAEIIDKALSYAIDVLLMRPDLFDDFVDNELRLFLLDNQKAKHILLDVMLSHPEYVPRAWGGENLRRRQREEQQKEDQKLTDVIEDKTVVEEETVRVLEKPSNQDEEKKSTTPNLKILKKSSDNEKLGEMKKLEKKIDLAEKDAKKEAEVAIKVKNSPVGSVNKEKLSAPKKSDTVVSTNPKKSDRKDEAAVKKAEQKSAKVRKKNSEMSGNKQAVPAPVRRISTPAPTSTQSQGKVTQDSKKNCKML